MKVNVVSMSLKASVPVLNAQGKYDRTAMVLPQNGRALSLLPGLGVLVEVGGHDDQLIPLDNVFYVRVAKGELAKGSK